MTQGTTYLELSEDGDGAHKFYEITVAGTTVDVRYGRIGADGTRQTTTFPTTEKAEAAAAKKIGEKVRKGYAAAVMGARAPRSVTRRTVVSTASTARATAPVLWRFRTGSSAFGIHVDGDRCWVGNQAGDVFSLDHDGQVLSRFHLPDGVKCLVADDFWIYAGCDDGSVYDLSAKIPHAAYQIWRGRRHLLARHPRGRAVRLGRRRAAGRHRPRGGTPVVAQQPWHECVDGPQRRPRGLPRAQRWRQRV
jgi:predicted DNA-binding WGR domain protein